MYCYRGTDMSTHFEKNYAQILAHREENMKKRGAGRNSIAI